jgi:hypothetical protein
VLEANQGFLSLIALASALTFAIFEQMRANRAGARRRREVAEHAVGVLQETIDRLHLHRHSPDICARLLREASEALRLVANTNAGNARLTLKILATARNLEGLTAKYESSDDPDVVWKEMRSRFAMLIASVRAYLDSPTGRSIPGVTIE